MKLFSYKTISPLFVIIAFFAFSACEKDTEAPVITTGEPVLGDTISIATDSVHMEFDVTDNTGLHELSVKLLDASGTAVYTDMPVVHDLLSYNYHEHYHPSGIVAPVKYTLTIVASDHHENVANASRDVYVRP